MTQQRARRRTVSPCNAYTFRFHLEAHTSLIFPQCRCDSRFHSGWGLLTGSIHYLRRVRLTRCTGAPDVGMLGMSA